MNPGAVVTTNVPDMLAWFIIEGLGDDSSICKEEHKFVKTQLHPHRSVSLTRPITGIEKAPPN